MQQALQYIIYVYIFEVLLLWKKERSLFDCTDFIVQRLFDGLGIIISVNGEIEINFPF